MKPHVLAVVKPSGHRTLRVVFGDAVPPPKRIEMLESLADLRASFEGADFAIDVEPSGDYDAVRGRLHAWERDELLAYL